jgi:hypothetical protein
MKSFLRTGAGLLAAASVVAAPMQASAQAANYDTVLYDLLLDCTALQVLFAQASDSEADKKAASNKAVGYLSAANTLSGAEIKDLGPVLQPRRAKILAMLDKKDGSTEKLVKSCAAIYLVGTNAAAAAK